MIHKPVLVKEVLEYLNPKPGENFIDGTIGQGGHTLLILERIAPGGRVLGIDLDVAQIENAKVEMPGQKERVVLVHDSYANVKNIALRENFTPVHGILLDLGYSSWQIENSGKGFSFQKDERLDMRYDLGSELTAETIVNEWPEEKLLQILDEYGEEKFAKQIARAVVKARNSKKIESTFELVRIIESTVPEKCQHGRIHCATRTFQALRIAVNDELGNLEEALGEAISVLTSLGRLVVISFHSLEDRMVKNFFREQEKGGFVKIITKKPITASGGELQANPRARSAKLRALIKV